MRYGILYQRLTSVIDGSDRERPIQPLRQQPGIVQIGNVRVRATYVSPEHLAAKAEAERIAFNLDKQSKRQHECAAASMGMFCGHAS